VTFNSAEEHGIYVSNSRVPDDNPIIRGNISYGNAGSGIQLNGDCYADGDGTIEGVLIEGNRVYGNDLKGLSIISAPGARIQNNVIYENGDAAGGVHLVDEPGCNKPTTAAIVVNNTINEPSMPGIQMNDGATGNIIFNNLIVEHPETKRTKPPSSKRRSAATTSALTTLQPRQRGVSRTCRQAIINWPRAARQSTSAWRRSRTPTRPPSTTTG
jgi:hypothetical protein